MKTVMRSVIPSRRLLWSMLIVALGLGPIFAQPPTIQIIFPQPGSSVEGLVNLRVHAEDGDGDGINGIDSVLFIHTRAPGDTIRMERVGTTGEWSGAWYAGGFANGTDNAIFRAYDNDNTSTDSVLSLTIANGTGAVQIPVIALTSPAAGSQVSGTAAVVFAVTSNTATTHAVSIDGGAYADLSPTNATTYNWNTASLIDGSHTLQFRAINTGGTSGTSQVITFIVNNTPTVTLNAPEGGTLISGNRTLTYSSVAAAPATIASESLYVDGKVLTLLSPSGTDTFNTTSLVDGEHSLQIKATDSNGKIGWSKLINVLVRNNPTIVLDSGLADSTVSGRLVISFDAQAVGPATVQSTELALNGGPFRATATDSSDTLDTRSLSDGSHLIQVRVTDSEGKTGLSQIIKFNLENAPSVRIDYPTVDAVVRGVLVVEFTAEAVAPDSIVSTQISIGGGEWIPTASASQHVLDTRNFKDGDLRIQVRATDAAGKSALSLTREFVVDNSPPVISLPKVIYLDNAPVGRAGTELLITAQGLDIRAGMDADSAMLFLSETLTDDGLRVLMRDDGAEGDVVKGDNIYSVRVTPTLATDGVISYSIRARDAVGNDTLITGEIILDNTPPEVALTIEPAPAKGTSLLEGEVYVAKVLISGTFSDAGGSSMHSVELVVRNDSNGHVNSSPDGIPLLDGKFRRIVHLVPGKNRIVLNGRDRAGNRDSTVAQLTYIVPKETKIVKVDGGSVFGANGSGVQIPSNALYKPEEITVRAASALDQPKPLDPKMRLLGVPYEFGPDGTVFRQPVTVTLAYTDADLDTNQNGKADFNPDKFSIVFWNGTTWVSAGDSRVDKTKRTVSVSVNHFTLFDIVQDDNAPPAKLVTFWNRNPIVGRSEFIYKVPKPGKVSLQILDMAGDLVHQLVRPNTPVETLGSVQWDGANVSGRFAGAGLYIYVFRYESDDGGTREIIRKPIGLARN